MPEDQDKIQKAKATLIKHAKDDENQSDSNHVKKKRVVVSSSGTAPKKVVVKRRPAKIVAKKSSEAESTEQPAKQDTNVKAVEKPETEKNNSSSTPKVSDKTERQSGYQGGSAPRTGGYQGNSPRTGGYQGNSPRTGGYQGNSPRTGGYQGNSPRTGGYQGGGAPRTGGYQGNSPRTGGYQGGGSPRTGGYQGNSPRPGGYQGGGAPRSGGYQGGGSNSNNSGGPTAPNADQKKSTSKKFFKSKKVTQYGKKKNIHSEKSYEYKKKIINSTNPVPREISMMETITVSELARKMNLKASDLISKLMKMGMMVTINQQIDFETAALLAEEYKCKIKLVSLYDETLIETEKDHADDLEARPAIVTVMGHVDHGKTKLLDAIRQTNVVGGEFGGITQHIGAYTVETEKGQITFLDTPGHSAFTLMRARGAQITDVVVLVVAANDGVMPQTIEAINHAKDAKVPIIVAVNKVDLPEANIERVKQQLSEYNLIPEDWSGSTQFVEMSALKRIGIDKLLDAISLEAELLELKANFNCNAEGKVIESKVDQGRGIVSSVLIERGTLKIGDSFVAGIFPGKVRAMFNDRGQKVTKADPSMPVEILGFSGIPDSGDPFQVTENEKIARQFGMKRQELKKHEEAKNVKKITLANLYDSIQDGAIQELKVIIKGDVHGSVEALKQTLEKLSTPEIRLVCIHSSAGAIIENDVTLAAASNAIIIGFHVRPTPKAQMLADQEKVEIKKYNIIYDAVEDVRSAMEGMLTPDLKEEIVGQVEVRETFKVPKIGTIAGCMVTSGFITRKSQIHVYREGIELFTGAITALKRFKDDAKEVREGFECGISLENFSDIKVGDIFEVFIMKEIAKKLGEPIDK
ncbi:MAG: translation initiation factor IF-2 [Spirochaetaceae bacterium]|jgi:translation initiation factor IF-2|nr:translation initiation factor IF-2 [Spirochaetaceae bacterium]